ncbi:MAG: UDP-4-amino-4,6-dideoxy-N-acetyl-beta-L-altrosamine transaminase [Kordiimonadaceae bacterium]|nr:UDP-4-amino-4,6-dideoxy-N-acetyl-beta-L-altrosamine transaminase [Kordiimonadaceae bacterium]MBO6570669.1 UDP-4-amino-4,6-dideoxy-N-acetyl-beta-L-altrosamine transaminase [Kordiimonadaceae bacterium]MBO6966473.1 UDP-4-amino-4,6-dideoxy-N-acetyl-beta-L-altrosamine transaminase [Kordiimonadaceae bacterium]
MPDQFLPYGRHAVDEDDIEAVVDVLRSAPLTAGPKIPEFEQAFARYIGVKEAVVCSNGTAALHLAAMAAGLQPGDVAIVPAITFLATANAVRMTGAEVCFADVDAETGLMTPETFSAALQQAQGPVKAVLPVHMNGQSEHMEAIRCIATENGLKVITDCCHALGADYKEGGKPGDGKYEDMATFSLHPVKSIAMGEGGFIVTNDEQLAHQMRLLRSHAMEKDPEQWQRDAGFDSEGAANPWYYEMQMLAYNYRATDMQCALGLSQLKKLDNFIASRRKIADLYDKAFAGMSNSVKPVRRSVDCVSAWHLYVVQFDFEAIGLERAALMKKLQSLGVGTQVHYVPVSSQPYYVERYGRQDMPGAESYYAGILSLPIFPAMTSADVEHVVGTINSVIRG